ncbi:hypothetical protein SCP_0806420 [Sparassis crispa]|uniref:Uncharacterized protein n=1 Tax=Sparassis crispa TaxID=139825 RepID=A0A401GV70_9APHY|nr:hypothetical protein SCP_0806420 [Sparassis crispa]GBE86118.1 hypothetical protein SCP_0806420 [Sparassis crispa]
MHSRHPRVPQGPAKPQPTSLHPPPTLDARKPSVANDVAAIVAAMSPWRHLHPSHLALPGRRTQLFGGAFVFGGLRAVQPRSCRAGHRGATMMHSCHLTVAKAPRSPTPPPRTLPRRSSMRAGPPRRTMALRSSLWQPRCYDPANLPPRSLQAPTLARVTSRHHPPTLLDLRRPSAANDRAAVITPAAAVQRPHRPPSSRSQGFRSGTDY